MPAPPPIGYHFYRRYYADIANRRVSGDGQPLTEQLTAMEFGVLQHFLEHPRELMAYADVTPLNHVERSTRPPLNDYISKIRRKLGLQTEECFTLVRGIGFRLDADVRPVTEEDRAEGAELYKISLSQFHHHTIESMRISLRQSLEAVKADPSGMAEAYVTAAYSYINLGVTGYAAELPQKVMPEARAAAQAALVAAPNLGRAYGILGLVSLIYDFDWQSAETLLKKALEFDPFDASSMLSYAHVLVTSGRYSDGLALVKEAAKAAPTDKIIYASEGWLHTFSGDAKMGIEFGEKTKSRFPEFPPGGIFLGLAYEVEGRYAEAIACYEKSLEQERSPAALAALGHLYGVMGDRAAALGQIEKMANLKKNHLISYVPAYCEAQIYVGLLEVEQALDALEVAYDQRCDWLIHLGVDPRWKPIRENARFKALVQRVGIPGL